MASVGGMKLGSQGLEVSAQGLGCLDMSTCYGPPKPKPYMITLIHHAVRSGITFLDTSDMYGPFTYEILLGKTLKGIRKEVELATKFSISNGDGRKKWEIRGDPTYVRVACEASLKRLDVNCIDFYYQHRIDTKIPIEITMSVYIIFSFFCCFKALAGRGEAEKGFTLEMLVCSMLTKSK